MIENIERIFASNEKSLLEDFLQFLKFPSISADSTSKEAVLACSEWVADYLRAGKLEVEKWETSGYPVVFAQNLDAGPDRPTVLFYGHYDVQPVDPLELWKSPPFEPTIRDGEVFARGAQDDKGQILFTMAALVAALKAGPLPVNVKLIVEGEEEVGSTGLTAILEQYADQLSCDHMVVVDVGFKDPATPAVVVGVRGMIALEVQVVGSNTDLHSGSHGGIVYNPNRALAEMLASVWDEFGVIQIPGFYDDVKELTSVEREKLSSEFDPDWYRDIFAAEAIGGEIAYTPLERAWIRPTFEINGIAGGYYGPGFKTVIPAQAVAKISCRLVPDQEPEEIGKKVKRFFDDRCPKGMTVQVKVFHDGRSVRSRANSSLVLAAQSAVSQVTGKQCVVTLEGGSIPVISDLVKIAKSELVMIGYGLPGDNMHAPNEHFGVDRMRKGFLTVLHLINNIAATTDNS